mmetsp:Transcript_16583/g.43034  ORF Transcript_16583/g.43034 Transcript_16583/m.43034 type:complete len:283 (+) Transcript_16583:79-927(+)
MDRVGGLGPKHVAGLARAAATSRPQPLAVFFDAGGVLSSDGLPSHGTAHILSEAGVDAAKGDGAEAAVARAEAAGKELWNMVKVGTISSDDFYRGILAAASGCSTDSVGAAAVASTHAVHVDYLARFAADGRDARIRALLERVKGSGYAVGVISNHVTSWLSDVFGRLGYSATVPPDSPIYVVSDAAGAGKPDRAIFTAALEGLRKELGPGSAAGALPEEELAAQCVFVDNKAKNVEAAVAAGFVGVLYEAYSETEDDLARKLIDVGVCLEPAEDEGDEDCE